MHAALNCDQTIAVAYSRAPASGEGGRVGHVVGSTHRIFGRIGEGGMSTVFKAEDLVSGKVVALKVLSTAMTACPDVAARFRTEARVLSLLDHPHIVRVVTDGTTVSGEPYMALEFLDGETVETRLRRDGPLELGECVEIASQLASALASAHAAAVVHRDVKPANVFLMRTAAGAPFVKLLDFGVCKDLVANESEPEASGLIGTPGYMAPEQANGSTELVDARADQYGLALLVYEMLTGKQPFSADGVSETLNRVRTVELSPVSSVRTTVPREVDRVVARALSKVKEERFSDVIEFVRELIAAANGCGVDEEAPTVALPPLRDASDSPRVFSNTLTSRTNSRASGVLSSGAVARASAPSQTGWVGFARHAAETLLKRSAHPTNDVTLASATS